MGEVGGGQSQVWKQAVSSDVHITTHVIFDPPPATSPIRGAARVRRVSRLSSSFFGSLFFIACSSFVRQLYSKTGLEELGESRGH